MKKKKNRDFVFVIKYDVTSSSPRSPRLVVVAAGCGARIVIPSPPDMRDVCVCVCVRARISSFIQYALVYCLPERNLQTQYKRTRVP